VGAVHPGGKYLYAAKRSRQGQHRERFRVDVKSGKLTLLNQMPSLGEDPCYLSFDKPANTSSLPTTVQGRLRFSNFSGGPTRRAHRDVKDAGATGPNKKHQEGPHAHWIETSPDNRFVLVADLGLDEVLVYKLDATSGTLHAE